MAVEASDIQIRLSTGSGSTDGDADASTPGASLGTQASTTEIVDNTIENLFSNITAAQAEVGRTVYRCIFIYNAHATETAKDMKVWISSQETGGGTVSIGLDATGVSLINSASDQAVSIASETAVPSGVTFETPTSVDNALVIGDLTAQQCYPIWLRLLVPVDSEAKNEDNAILIFKGYSDP